MNSPFDVPMPDPLEAVENSIQQPFPEAQIPPYPEDLLDGLEAAIEENPVPQTDNHIDPVGRILDAVEAATENQMPVSPISGPDPLHDILDRLEAEVENQSRELNEVLKYPSQDDSQDQIGMGGIESKPMLFDLQQVSYFKQFHLPTHRLHGSRTGFRQTSGGFDFYCVLKEMWVWKEECRYCPDFENTHSDSEDEDERKCKHANI